MPVCFAIYKGARFWRALLLFLLLAAFFPVDQFLERSAGLEHRKLRGRNLDFLARLRVAALAHAPKP